MVSRVHDTKVGKMVVAVAVALPDCSVNRWSLLVS